MDLTTKVSVYQLKKYWLIQKNKKFFIMKQLVIIFLNLHKKKFNYQNTRSSQKSLNSKFKTIFKY